MQHQDIITSSGVVRSVVSAVIGVWRVVLIDDDAEGKPQAEMEVERPTEL